MQDFQKNNNRESSEILTSITMVSDMPPSYDVAIENVTASHQKLFNSTKTELKHYTEWVIERNTAGNKSRYNSLSASISMCHY